MSPSSVLATSEMESLKNGLSGCPATEVGGHPWTNVSADGSTSNVSPQPEFLPSQSSLIASPPTSRGRISKDLETLMAGVETYQEKLYSNDTAGLANFARVTELDNDSYSSLRIPDVVNQKSPVCSKEESPGVHEHALQETIDSRALPEASNSSLCEQRNPKRGGNNVQQPAVDAYFRPIQHHID